MQPRIVTDAAAARGLHALASPLLALFLLSTVAGTAGAATPPAPAAGIRDLHPAARETVDSNANAITNKGQVAGRGNVHAAERFTGRRIEVSPSQPFRRLP